MANLLTSLVFAFWIVAIALLSVQNYTLVSLRFLQFQSVQIPLGVVMAIGIAIGALGMAALLPLLAGKPRPRPNILEDDL